MYAGLLRDLITNDENCRSQRNALQRIMSRSKQSVTADNLHALFSSGAWPRCKPHRRLRVD